MRFRFYGEASYLNKVTGFLLFFFSLGMPEDICIASKNG